MLLIDIFTFVTEFEKSNYELKAYTENDEICLNAINNVIHILVEIRREKINDDYLEAVKKHDSKDLSINNVKK